MLIGNSKVIELFDKSVASKELSHAYLFVGQKNLGKTTFAKHFATKILCDEGEACGSCENCKLSFAGNHPDLMIYDSEDTLGVDETRELIKFLDLKPFQADKKVVIIAHAERMTTSAANSFLKTLEEPSGSTIIILTTENQKNLLPTISSRVQSIKFTQPSAEEIHALREKLDIKNWDECLELSAGRIGLILDLASSDDKRIKLYNFLTAFMDTISVGTITSRLKFAEKLAKEKEDLSALLGVFEIGLHQKIKEDNSEKLKLVEILDKLTKTKEVLSKNANTQLALESLMLMGVSR